jgi:hypothetical protein
MKNKRPENDLFLYLWGIITLSLFILLAFSSCSPEYHLGKFKKKGGKIECKGDTVQIEKIVKDIHGKDSLIYVPVTEYVPQIEYKTKWQVRFDNKRFKDSLDFVKKQNKINQKTLIKEVKVKGKTEVKVQRAKSRWYLWLILGFVMAHFLRYLSHIIGAFRNFPNGRI